MTSNTIAASPAPDVQENITTTDGIISGTVTVNSSRELAVEGFVNTSHGKVRTEVVQNITQTTIIHQEYNSHQIVTDRGRHTIFFSDLSNVVTPADTLLFDPSGSVTGNQGQENSQRYFSTDSTGACYSRAIRAADGVLTAITNGDGCR